MSTLLKRVASAAFLLALCGGFLELASRTIHLWKVPLLPYYFDHEAALLPSRCDITASFYGRPANRYITDAWAARIASPSLATEQSAHGVFVVGDSQMLGYMLDFRETFASLVAGKICADPTAARILAAPANHPASFGPLLDASKSMHIPKQRLEIVGLNLGNDLDEMYMEGLNWDREKSNPLSRWLLIHSFVYEDAVNIWSHRLHAGAVPAGVNPILYMLAPDERIVLAREAVDAIDLFFKDPRITAEHRLVVIVPSDYQVDPREFDKYRRYYDSQADFDKWANQILAYAGMMDALEEYIANRLTTREYTVVRFSKIARARKLSGVFDDTSHHLTALSHRLLADAVIEAVSDK